MNSNLKVSVIIPTYNSWKTLKPCIDSIYKQTLKATEIIVVNNGSSDKTAANVKKYFSKIKLINLKKNTGVTGGRNAGIEKSNKKCKYLLFFDHDMVAEKDMLESLVKIASSNSKYGIVTPKIYYFEDKKKIWAAGTNINLTTGQVLFRGGKDIGQFEKVEQVQIAPACLLVKRKVIDELIGFDTRYFATYEDSDFCFRAKQIGYLTIYVPKAKAFHKIPLDLNLSNKRLLQRAYWIGRNRIVFMSSNASNFYLFLLFSPIYTFYFLILALSQQEIKGFINYLNGYLAGLMEYLVHRRLMIKIPFSTYWSIEKAVGFEKKNVLDVGCGEGKKMGILNYHKNWKVTGIEIYEPDAAIARSSGTYEKVIIGNLKDFNKIYSGKKFDVVFCSEVVEHLNKNDGLKLIEEMERVGKKIVITTPKGFVAKHEACFFEGDNIYQVHLSGWEIAEFRKMGYQVFGSGVNFIHRENNFSQKIGNYKFLAPIKSIIGFLENLLAYLLSPLSYYFPNFATTLLAVKYVKKIK